MSEILPAGTLERPEDAGKGPKGVVNRWMLELHLADKEEEDWRTQARDTIARYRDERERHRIRRQGQSSFNILWSNTEIQAPALYSNTPRPDVRRRMKHGQPELDELFRDIAEGLERALRYAVDEYDLDHCMNLAVSDYLLPGRAVTRVRYVPEIRRNEEGQPQEVVAERLEYEHSQWDMFRRGPGKVWGDVSWIAFGHDMTREQLVERFGRIGERVELDAKPIDMDRAKRKEDQKREKQALMTGRVWEIWDKDAREIIHIAPSVEDAPLDVEPDPLRLRDFFPIPRPLYAVQNTDTLTPIEADRQYFDQQQELDEITHRIRRLRQAVKARGVYDSRVGELRQVIEGDDNEMIPSQTVQNILAQRGADLRNHVWMYPIEDVVAALNVLTQQRQEIKQTIYEITGLSDILRGATSPSETLGAQQLKAQTGSLRMQKRQREVQRYARDLIAISAEIMAEHFQPETLSLMAGELVTEEHLFLLRAQGLRDYSINVETDSTIAIDQNQDQQAITELLGGLAQFASSVLPAVEAGFLNKETAQELMLTAARRFRMGRALEQTLEADDEQAVQAIDPHIMQQLQEEAMQQAMAAAEQQVGEERAQLEAAKAELAVQQDALRTEAAKLKAEDDARGRDIKLSESEAILEMDKAAFELERRVASLEGLNGKLDVGLNSLIEREAQVNSQGERIEQADNQIRELANSIAQMAEAMSSNAAQQTEANAAMVQALTAEKEIVRDANGRPIGARIRLDS